MADITMCHDPKDCPKRYHCYRYTALPDRLQSYCDFYGSCKDAEYNNYWNDDGYPDHKLKPRFRTTDI